LIQSTARRRAVDLGGTDNVPYQPIPATVTVWRRWVTGPATPHRTLQV